MRQFFDAFLKGYNESMRREPPAFNMTRAICDLLVWYGVFKCVMVPTMLIVSGTLSGEGVLAGMVIIAATAEFGLRYFGDEDDAKVL